MEIVNYKSDYWCETCQDVFTLTEKERNEHEKTGHDIGDKPLH